MLPKTAFLSKYAGNTSYILRKCAVYLEYSCGAARHLSRNVLKRHSIHIAEFKNLKVTNEFFHHFISNKWLLTLRDTCGHFGENSAETSLEEGGLDFRSRCKFKIFLAGDTMGVKNVY